MKRKIFSLLLCVVMLLSMLAVCVFPASAATNPYPTIQYVGGVATLPCTNYAWQQTYDRLGIALPAWGNAINWYNNAANAGYSVGSTPRANSIAVWSMEPMHSLGHVAFVTAVNGSNMTINESGRIDRPETNGIVNGQVVSSVVGTTCFEGRYLIGFIYLSASSSAYSYTNISEGNYYIQNVKTGGFIIYENGIDANEQNVVLTPFSNHKAQKMYIKSTSVGYKIQPNGTSRVVNPHGTSVKNGLNVNIYNDVNDSSEWWRFEKVSGGYVIHNVQNENCVLDATEYGNVVVSNYQKGNQSQIWKIEKSNLLPAVPTFTYKVKDQKIEIEFENYKSNEVHEVILRDEHWERVYAMYNIEGQKHITTMLSPGTYTLFVVAVNKNIGIYQTSAGVSLSISPSCSHRYDNACDKVCNNCGATRAVGPHIYSNSCDATCNTCGATHTPSHSYGGYVYNNNATYEKDGTKTRVCSTCGASQTVTAKGTKLSYENAKLTFTDVKNGAYYESAVGWAVKNGVTTGTSATKFSPEEKCTRAQIVTFLWRAVGSPKVKAGNVAFTDIKKGSYYFDAVIWAVKNGVTAGTTKSTFEPDSVCTRAQIVTFLWRSQGGKKANAANPFTDVKSSDYYCHAVLWAVKNGITTGTSATKFGPDEACTRAQCVTFLYRAQ